MNAKYFTADNRETAVKIAADYFDCDAEDITFEIISDKEDGSYCQILAIVGTPGEVANMNAHYGIYYESDGVYLELYNKRGAGYNFDSDGFTLHLNRKNIRELDMSAVQSLIKKAVGRVKIARAQDEYVYGESINVLISADERHASAILLAPEPEGPQLSVEDAKKTLAEAGVTHGVDEQALATLLESKAYGGARVVAFATSPEDGEDGKLVFNFSIDERTGCPKELGCGRVDYRSLDLYVPVEVGQLLVSRSPATDGTPGKTVTGNEIKQRPGKEVMFPRGKNVEINDDKTKMYALCSGMVEFVNNSVDVSSVYDVNGDCDLSVGNIDFDGSVHVHGSVRSGYTIRATGGVIIDGGIEAATVIAGGNVEVKGGMQGANRGLIEAGGAVSILYVERGTIRADGPVMLDVSIHSTIEAGESLTAKGQRGAIIGGRVGSTGSIIANYVGALSHTRTEIAVGVTPRKRARLQFVETELERLSIEKANLDRLDTYLDGTIDTMAPEKWELLHRSSAENRRLNTECYNAFLDEKNTLVYELEHATDGMVHVFNTVFSGARVLIGSNAYVVNDEISYVSFKHNDSNVVFGPCELSMTS